MLRLLAVRELLLATPVGAAQSCMVTAAMLPLSVTEEAAPVHTSTSAMEEDNSLQHEPYSSAGVLRWESSSTVPMGPVYGAFCARNTSIDHEKASTGPGPVGLRPADGLGLLGTTRLLWRGGECRNRRVKRSRHSSRPSCDSHPTPATACHVRLWFDTEPLPNSVGTPAPYRWRLL